MRYMRAWHTTLTIQFEQCGWLASLCEEMLLHVSDAANNTYSDEAMLGG
jgi:hypothetical protein